MSRRPLPRLEAAFLRPGTGKAPWRELMLPTRTFGVAGDDGDRRSHMATAGDPGHRIGSDPDAGCARNTMPDWSGRFPVRPNVALCDTWARGDSRVLADFRVRDLATWLPGRAMRRTSVAAAPPRCYDAASRGAFSSAG